jgi:hypothetical protein
MVEVAEFPHLEAATLSGLKKLRVLSVSYTSRCFQVSSGGIGKASNIDKAEAYF